MSLFGTFDQSMVLSLNNFLADHHAVSLLAQIIGEYGIYCIPLAWLVAWFTKGKNGRELLLSSLTAGLLAWQLLNRIGKGFYFQARPLNTLPVRELLFRRPENSFPSDHAAFLFGIAFFFLLRKRFRPSIWLSVVAVIISLTRIALAFHYPSDIIGGLVSGFLAAWIIHLLHNRLSATVWPHCLKIARYLHLA